MVRSNFKGKNMFLKSSFMLSVFCLVFSPVGSFADNEMPTNPDIISGNLAISSSSNSMTVDQISESGIINWDGFSIGSGNSVDFNNGTGTTLNRVTVQHYPLFMVI